MLGKQEVDSCDKVDEAGSVVNYIVNDVEFYKITGLTMGAPINPRVREEYLPFASEDEIEMLELISEVGALPARPRYEAPAGSNNWRTIMTRTAEEIAIGDAEILQASQRMIDEISAELDRAR